MVNIKLRINIYITPELDAEIKEMADVLGMSKSRMASVAVNYGIQALKMATNPEMKEFFERQLKNEKLLK